MLDADKMYDRAAEVSRKMVGELLNTTIACVRGASSVDSMRRGICSVIDAMMTNIAHTYQHKGCPDGGESTFKTLLLLNIFMKSVIHTVGARADLETVKSEIIEGMLRRHDEYVRNLSSDDARGHMRSIVNEINTLVAEAEVACGETTVN